MGQVCKVKVVLVLGWFSPQKVGGVADLPTGDRPFCDPPARSALHDSDVRKTACFLMLEPDG